MGGEGSGRIPNPETIAKRMMGNTGREVTQWLPTAPAPKPSATRTQGFTDGSVIFTKGNEFTEDNTNLFWDDTNNRLGIGTTTPDNKLNVYGGNLMISGSTAPSLLINASSGSDYSFGANVDATGMGIYDSTGGAWRLFVQDTTGNVGIGTQSPTSKLHADQSSSTAAIPVLTLDQGDDSEEMIEFIGTIGTGNAIEAVAAKTLTTTHFIKVTLPGGLTRYIPVGTIA